MTIDRLTQLRGLIAGLIAAEDHGDRAASAMNQAGILEMFDDLTAALEASRKQEAVANP